MNNIIANLRRDRPLSWENRLEAADEIFRLREENEQLKREAVCRIEHLQREQDAILELVADYNEAVAENARLREALEGLQEIIAHKYEIGTDIEGGKEDE